MAKSKPTMIWDKTICCLTNGIILLVNTVFDFDFFFHFSDLFTGVYNGDSMWIHVNCDSDDCPKLALLQTASAPMQSNVAGHALDNPRTFDGMLWPTNCYLSFGQRCGADDPWNGFLASFFCFCFVPKCKFFLIS